MSNERYTGPSARETKEETDIEIRSFRESINPVDEVNKIVAELGLDDRYFVDPSGVVSSAYEAIPKEERAINTNKIQKKIIEKARNTKKTIIVKSRFAQKNNENKVKPRYDRILIAGMAVAMLTSIGYSTVKHVIEGARGNAEFEKSMSDNIKDERDEDYVILKDEPKVVHDIRSSTKEEVESSKTAQHEEDDRISYVLDFSDYYNKSEKEHIFEMIDNGIVDGIGFKIGGSCIDYPFKVITFDEEYMDTYVADHIEADEVTLKKSLGKLEWLEEFIVRADTSMPYYYSCALNDEEAEIEADCIEAVYKMLEKDLPEYNFKRRMAPITIDIEYSGNSRMHENGTSEEMEKAMEQRTDAVLHLIDCLQERGVIDERGVIIYGDLNRMEDHSHINWERLFNEIEEKDVRLTKWGTRALRKTFGTGIEYSDVFDFQDNLMNTSNNISWMKDDYDHLQPYLGDIAMQQIHLDQQIKTNFTYEEYFDVNITTVKTLEAIVTGKKINYEKNLIDRLEEVNLNRLKENLTKSADTEPQNELYENNEEER